MHLNLRKEHMPFFKPGYVDELQNKVSIKVSQLLDEAEKLNEFNLVKRNISTTANLHSI